MTCIHHVMIAGGGGVPTGDYGPTLPPAALLFFAALGLACAGLAVGWAAAWLVDRFGGRR